MGCGASRASSATAPEIQVVRDPEDFELENVVLQRTQLIPEFDATFEELETILAQFITWNNVINDYAVNVQNLLAPALGAMVAEVSVGRNVDALHLDLVTPFNKQRASPQHHILIEWLKNKELREADAALAQARLDLCQFVEAQAEAAFTALRAAGRPSGAGQPPAEVPRLARNDTAGAATLALLVEAPPPGSPGSGGASVSASFTPTSVGVLGPPGTANGAGRSNGGSPGRAAGGGAGPSLDASTNGNSPRAPGAGGGQATAKALASGPGRPPGTADSASTDASDLLEPPTTLGGHCIAFNSAVSVLQHHLGPNFGVYFHVTPAACPVKGRCAHVRLMRHPQPAKLAAAIASGAAADPKSEHNPRSESARGRSSSAAASAAAYASGAAGSAGGAGGSGSGSAAPPPSRFASMSAANGRSQGGLGPSPLGMRMSHKDDPGPAPGSAAAILGEEACPATLVDMVYSGMTDAILKAERSVAVVGNELAKLFEKYEPPLSLVEEPKQCRKLKTLPVAKEYVEANCKIQQLNAVLFKLAKAVAKTAWIYSTPLSLPDGVMGDVAQMVCEALRRVADTTWQMCKKQLDSVHLVSLLTHYEPFTITPRFTNDDATFQFDLDVVVDQALLIDKTFPDFLPQQMRNVWDSLLALAAVVQESRVSLGSLRASYAKLHEEVRELYTLAPEAAKQRRLGIADAAGVVKVINANLSAIYDAEKVFDTYTRNVQRIADAYTRAQREIKADLQGKLAELTTKLPRNLVKPTFSPEMLQLARAAVNPQELAATMTLALTASQMDPAQAALLQHQLAAGAMAGASGLGKPGSSAQPVGPHAGASAAGLPGAGIGAAAALAQQQQMAAAAAVQMQQMQQMQQIQQMQAMQALQMQQAAAAAAGYGAAAGMYGTPMMNGGTPNAAAAAAVGAGVDYATQIAQQQQLAAALAQAGYGAGTAGAGAVQQDAGAMAAAYQNAGYDANTISMLAQMGYGGFAVGAQQQTAAAPVASNGGT